LSEDKTKDPYGSGRQVSYLDTVNLEQVLQQAIMFQQEKNNLELELRRVQAELKKLQRELENLRKPPLLVGTISEIMDDSHVLVKSTAGPEIIVEYRADVDETLLKPGVRVALNKDTLALISILTSRVDPVVRGAEIIDRPSVTFADIGGLEKQIEEIEESVELPMLKPELFEKVGIEPPKGVLLIGPPGTGKTMLAKAVANFTNATFISMVGSELVRKYIGEGAQLVKDLFRVASEKAPSIIFLDELDAIGAKRMDSGTTGDREVQRTLMQLLAELDGFNPRGEVRIIAASNRPDILDEALLRPGRFDRIIRIPMPDKEAISAILNIYLGKLNLAKDVDRDWILNEMHGASGAEIKALCTEAGMQAVRREGTKVCMDDFKKGLERLRESDDNDFEDAMFG